jgi:shikimate dehydrogenase
VRLFGLIGFPLAHSFSKNYFTDKFLREGLADCRYELFPIENIEELPKVIADHPELCGLNVTIPYKEPVIAYLHQSFLPQGLSACNCIRIKEAGLEGFNTDHIGFGKTLAPHLTASHKKALVFGNGGSARAVIFVLKKMGIEYHLVSRELHSDSSFTYQEITEEMIAGSELLINTTPLGMYPRLSGKPEIPYEGIGPGHLVFDIVYNPVKTLFLGEAEKRGATIVNGMEMLRVQAEESWRIWNA